MREQRLSQHRPQPAPPKAGCRPINATALEAWVRTIWVFAGLFLVWWVLDGANAFLPGLAAVLLGTGLFLALGPHGACRLRLLRLPPFAAYFVLESFRGGMDVAVRALTPRLPIDPHLVDYPVRLPDGPPKVMFMCVIGLLPGTVTADLSDDERTVRIHTLIDDPRTELAALEQHIARLYGVEEARTC